MQCEICGAETDNVAATLKRRYVVCDRCINTDECRLPPLTKDQRMSRFIFKILQDEGDDE